MLCPWRALWAGLEGRAWDATHCAGVMGSGMAVSSLMSDRSAELLSSWLTAAGVGGWGALDSSGGSIEGPGMEDAL